MERLGRILYLYFPVLTKLRKAKLTMNGQLQGNQKQRFPFKPKSVIHSFRLEMGVIAVWQIGHHLKIIIGWRERLTRCNVIIRIQQVVNLINTLRL